jgi:hypothetical protein
MMSSSAPSCGRTPPTTAPIIIIRYPQDHHCHYNLNMCQFRLLIATLLLGAASAFTPMITTAPAMMTRATSLHMMDVSGVPDIASTGLILAEAEPWVQPLSLVLDPFLNLFSFAMVSFALMPPLVCADGQCIREKSSSDTNSSFTLVMSSSPVLVPHNKCE